MSMKTTLCALVAVAALGMIGCKGRMPQSTTTTATVPALESVVKQEKQEETWPYGGAQLEFENILQQASETEEKAQTYKNLIARAYFMTTHYFAEQTEDYLRLMKENGFSVPDHEAKKLMDRAFHHNILVELKNARFYLQLDQKMPFAAIGSLRHAEDLMMKRGPDFRTTREERALRKEVRSSLYKLREQEQYKSLSDVQNFR